jgi:hypothetical protein
MQGVLPLARECIRRLITERTGSTEISYDAYREWGGNWRIAIEVRGPVTGTMDFILFHTTGGGILAMPAQLPQRWRVQGIPASDGSLWTMDDAGRVVPLG